MMKKYGGGGFDFDPELLKEQQKNINKMQAMREFDEMEEKLSKKGQASEGDGKSLKDMLKEKRENTEKVIEGKGPQQQENAEERKRRLQAQRDILVKMK